MTWKALNGAIRDSGAPTVDYMGFNTRWQQEEQMPPEEQILHNLVDRFDSQGIVLKTAAKQPTEPGMGGEQEAKSKISQMARHAMKSS